MDGFTELAWFTPLRELSFKFNDDESSHNQKKYKPMKKDGGGVIVSF
jgi:hypothetical protein